MSDLVNIYVRARAERRCRCGRCFDATGSLESVTAEELKRLQSDPMLIVVTEADAEAAEEAEAQGDTVQTNTVPAPDASAKATGKPTKPAAKTAKKAG